MKTDLNQILRGALAAASLAATGTASYAQGAPCLTYTGTGSEIRQFSRMISGRILPGISTITPTASTTVIILNCQPIAGVPGAKSRQVNYGQMVIDFSVQTPCDEVQQLKGTLVGDYFSLTRLFDPFGSPTQVDNTRVGRHNANGKVYDQSSPPALIGTFSMRGIIGANTQRPTSMFGTGPCYWCQHHEGVINIKLNQSPLFVGGGTITASYCWDVNVDSANCQSDPCLMQQYFSQGTMDGIVEAACGTIKM
ncbi:MAG TPA: hypothetical protein VGM51_19515 [Armatimonadota bacterium]|jgi:hypothetical protein